ncbi:MAG: acetyltransferase [Snowella sp.]|nr:acetyltransferase [Snowella sp.]
MLLQEKETGNLVKVMDFQSLINPNESEIIIQIQAGQEEQDPELRRKNNLSFPSGENLPICWLDANYRYR